MKQIVTGKTPLPFITAAAILSLSLVVNLPGLAVSPMLETIKHVFPGTTKLETQLLTMLPNVLIIPFVLLSGKISTTRHKMRVVVVGLLIYALSALAYLFASSMTALIVISCCLGAGAGIIVPFSTGLIADTFTGVYQMKEMGLQSAIANMSLVAATFVVGWLQHGNWHLPFLVYLVTLIPLALSPWIRKIPSADESVPAQEATSDAPASDAANSAAAPASSPSASSAASDFPDADTVRFRKNGFSYSRTFSVYAVYFLVTALTIVISYYCPFLAQSHGWSESLTGSVTSIYFLFIFLPGFFLTKVLRICRDYTGICCASMIIVGLVLFAFFPAPATLCIGAALCGFGYGVMQPLMYDKATRVVNSESKATLALAIVLSANYLAIVAAPFIIDGVRGFIPGGRSTAIPFIINTCLAVLFLLFVIVKRHSFCLHIPAVYSK